MKKIIVLLLLISLQSFGQKKDSVLTDSTKFLSISDLARLSEKYQDKATYKEYQSFLNIINMVIKEAIIEYNEKLKTKN